MPCSARLPVDGAGAHRLADPRPLEEQGQQPDREQRSRDDPEELVVIASPPIRSAGGWKGRQGARLVAHCDQGQALDHDLRGKGGEDHDEHCRASVPQRPYHQSLDHDADQGDAAEGDERRGNQRNAEPVQARVCDHAAEHHECALCEIHDAAGSVDTQKPMPIRP